MEGFQYQLHIAVDLLCEGFVVSISTLRFDYGLKETLAQRSPSDIDVSVLVGQVRFRLEVKSYPYKFTGPEDFPFELAFVGTIPSWEKSLTPPHATVIVSQLVQGGRLVVPSSTKNEWVKTSIFDAKRGIYEPTFGARKDSWRTWEQLVSWLRHRANVKTISPTDVKATNSGTK